MFLSVSGVTKSFETAEGRVPVLQGVSFELERGKSLALTGESGSGKSTLLHIIGGLESADAGGVVLDGTEITRLDDRGHAALRRNKVGVVFQQFNLIPSLTVESNIAFHGRLNGRYDPAFARGLAERLGLAEQLTKYPEQLSGGQQQRVAIARTLVAKPALVLADEPTGNLDEATAQVVLDLMLELVREAGATLMMVTHSTQLAARLGRRIHLHGGRTQ